MKSVPRLLLLGLVVMSLATMLGCMKFKVTVQNNSTCTWMGDLNGNVKTIESGAKVGFFTYVDKDTVDVPFRLTPNGCAFSEQTLHMNPDAGKDRQITIDAAGHATND